MDEINHTFVMKNKNIKKTIFHDRNPKKASASESELSVEDCRKWIEEILKRIPKRILLRMYYNLLMMLWKSRIRM